MIDFSRAGDLAIATLARPPVNAIDERWLTRLAEVLEQGRDAAVLLLRSREKAFSAGADLELMRSRFDSAEGRSRMVAFVREMQRVFARVEAASQVTIAEIGGPALGGGLELALCCDLRIAADEARLGLPEARLGLVPGAGGTQRLPRIAGEAVAKRLILGAEVISGTQAATLGVVQWAVPEKDLQEKTLAIARSIANLPATALAEAKACIGAANGYERELSATATLLAQEETQRRVREFLEARRQLARSPASALRGRS